jgi:hypothetical protein
MSHRALKTVLLELLSALRDAWSPARANPEPFQSRAPLPTPPQEISRASGKDQALARAIERRKDGDWL